MRKHSSTDGHVFDISLTLPCRPSVLLDSMIASQSPSTRAGRSVTCTQASALVSFLGLRPLPSKHPTWVKCIRSSVRAGSVKQALFVEHIRHVLPDGATLEVIQQKANTETFLPYFAGQGYNSYAISFRQQGKSSLQSDSKVAGSLASHAADVQHFVESLPQPPVIVAHSLSGLVAQRFLLGDTEHAPSAAARNTAGLILLASSPPAGNGALVRRTFRRRPLFSIRLTWAFITKSYTGSLPRFKEMFFTDNILEQDIQRWFQLLQQNTSSVPLVDLRDMNKHELPLCKPPADFNIPVLVVVGSNDAVMDVEAARETAEHFGQQDVVQLPDLAHDLMLDTRWESAAVLIDKWVSSHCC